MALGSVGPGIVRHEVFGGYQTERRPRGASRAGARSYVFSGQLFLRILRANVLAHGSVSRRTNQAGLPLRLTQRPGFLGSHQVAINHVLDCVPSTVGPLDGTMPCQLCLSSLRPSLRCLLTGERLGFLVD